MDVYLRTFTPSYQLSERFGRLQVRVEALEKPILLLESEYCIGGRIHRQEIDVTTFQDPYAKYVSTGSRHLVDLEVDLRSPDGCLILQQEFFSGNAISEESLLTLLTYIDTGVMPDLDEEDED